MKKIITLLITVLLVTSVLNPTVYASSSPLTINPQYNKTTGKLSISGIVPDGVDEKVTIKVISPSGKLVYVNEALTQADGIYSFTGATVTENGVYLISVYSPQADRAQTVGFNLDIREPGEVTNPPATPDPSLEPPNTVPQEDKELEDAKDAINDLKDAKPEDKAKLLEKVLETVEKAMNKASIIEDKFIEKTEDDTSVTFTIKKEAIEDLVEKLLKTKESLEVALKDTGLDKTVDVERKEIKLEVRNLAKKKIKITLPAKSVKILEAKKIGLIIQANNLTFKVPSAAIVIDSGVVQMELTVKKIDTTELGTGKGLTIAGDVFDFDMALSDGTTSKKVESFRQKVTVKLSYNGKDINEDKLGIYRYNSQTKVWDYIAGKVNKEEKTIEFATPHFSIYTVMEYNKTFSDIANHWAKDAIELMAAKHIVNGMNENTFDPEGKITRAQAVSAIVKALGLDIVDYNNAFGDVSADQWYAKVVQTAANKGLIEGDRGKFRPEDTITREEMTALIVRAYKFASGKTPTVGDISKFRDKEQISIWAQEGVKAAYGLGIINGMDANTFAPKSDATRAQAITIIMRLLGII